MTDLKPMPRYVEPSTWHRDAVQRMTWHTGALEDCERCNRPTFELVADRVAIFTRSIQRPENQDAATLAELTHWYLTDAEDIRAGRPLSYVPNLPGWE